MNRADKPSPAHPRLARYLIYLVIITAVLSLVYGVQYYAGGPIRLSVVSGIHDLALSPDGSWIAAAVDDGTVRVWSTGDWTMRTLAAHSGPVTRVAFLPDGLTLISAGHDGTIRRWDVASGQSDLLLDAGSGPLNDLSLSADGSLLATIGDQGIVKVWELGSARQVGSFGPNPQTRTAVALSPDGTLVAAGEGSNIQVWDVRSGEAFRRLEGHWQDEEKRDTWLGHQKEVTALAFDPDGQLLVSGAADATCIFWSLEDGSVQWTAEGHYGRVARLIFSQDGKAVLSGSADTKVRSWRVPGGKFTAVYEGHLSTVTSVRFGPQPDQIVSAGEDGTLRVWETANQKVLRIEWPRYGLQRVWGSLLGGWMLASGLLGLLCAWGLWRIRIWSHLLTLALYLLGPLVVLGLPLLEVLSYPLTAALKVQIAWPLAVLWVWYLVLLILLTREPVALFYEAPQQASLAETLMVSRRTTRTRFGIYSLAVWIGLLVVLYSVLRRFNLDVAFMGHYFSFIMKGSWITFRVSALSISLAVVLALLGALGRLSRNPIANGISSFYVSLIRGTPLLVQIYIWYLGLPRLNVVLPAEPAGILALGVNYGAYMTEIFRAGIQAIGKGQYEAAEALGMTRRQTFQRIVLPQAFRIVIPPIGNEFIAMMKDSALVSVMAVWELSYRAQKIGRQYFRALETFLIAAAFYWILTVIFQFLQGKLEAHMARSERR